MFSPRNHIELHHVMQSEIELVDTLFEICDAEFNSRKDVHDSFNRESSPKRWARYYLVHEVLKSAKNNNLICSKHLASIIANELAGVWFGCSEVVIGREPPLTPLEMTIW